MSPGPTTPPVPVASDRLEETGLSVVTLGTQAGPAIRTDRPGIATAIVVDGTFYLVDFGLGVTRAAHEAGLRGRDLGGCFITHLHSDHVAEIPGYLLWNWGPPVEGIETKVPMLGPGPGADGAVGTRGMVEKLFQAYSYDIDIRTEDEGRVPLYDLVDVREIQLPASAARATGTHTPEMEPFVVFQDERVTVSAILVEHPPVFPAFAFRFDTRYGSVVVSGDTTECRNMVTLARDVDVLVHESVNLDFFRQGGFGPQFVNHQEISHTTPAGVGRVATAARARQVVLSHLAGAADDGFWTTRVSATYDGPISVARPGQVYRVQAPVGAGTVEDARTASPGRG